VNAAQEYDVLRHSEGAAEAARPVEPINGKASAYRFVESSDFIKCLPMNEQGS
jgi:hypothetical protein